MAYIWDIPAWRSGAKIRCKSWCEGKYIRRVSDGLWDGTTKLTDHDMACMLVDDWELYIDPESVEVFEWMIRQERDSVWFVSDYLRTESQAAKEFEGQEYRKTGRSFKVPVKK